MNIEEAKNEIKNTVRIYLAKDDGEYVIPINKQRPVLLIGAPGIGKTAIMNVVAEELGIGFLGYTITHHTRQSAIGLPFISEKTFGGKKYSVTEYTMSEIVASVYEAIENQGKKEGILFIDEINCVSETLTPAMLELLQNKRFGPHKIPDGWILCAAGNPSEYNKSANELDMVTLDRVKKIEIEPDFDAFEKYSAVNGIHPSIIGFLKLNRQYLFKAEKTLDGFEFVTPRGWEDLSVAIREYEKLDISVTLAFVSQYVQSEDIAASFFSHYKTYGKFGNILGDDFDFSKAESNFNDLTFEEKFALSEVLKEKITLMCYDALSMLKGGEGAETAIKTHGAKTIENFGADYSKKLRKEQSVFKKSVYKSIIGVLMSENPTEEAKKTIADGMKRCEKTAEEINSVLLFAESVLGKDKELTSMTSSLIADEGFIEFIMRFNIAEFDRLNEELLVGDDLREKAKNALK